MNMEVELLMRESAGRKIAAEARLASGQRQKLLHKLVIYLLGHNVVRVFGVNSQGTNCHFGFLRTPECNHEENL